MRGVHQITGERELLSPAEEKALDRKTYKLNEVAQALGLGKTTIHKLIREGELQKIKLGRSTLILAESVEALLRRHAV